MVYGRFVFIAFYVNVGHNVLAQTVQVTHLVLTSFDCHSLCLSKLIRIAAIS